MKNLNKNALQHSSGAGFCALFTSCFGGSTAVEKPDVAIQAGSLHVRSVRTRHPHTIILPVVPEKRESQIPTSSRSLPNLTSPATEIVPYESGSYSL